MGVGFKSWDTAGNLLFDTTSRSGRIIGFLAVDSGTTSGSVTDAHFGEGQPFYFIASTLAEGQPNISFAGNVMSWSKPTGYETWTGSIYYGVR